MSEPLYVPVLPTRPHAAAAYRGLRPDTQNAVMPLWSLPPRPGLSRTDLAVAVRKDLTLVVQAQRYQQAWLDAPFAVESEVGALAGLLREASARGPLRPVTGPGRAPGQQAAALAIARAAGYGGHRRHP